MKKSSKIIAGMTFLIALVLASAIYTYVFLGEHRDIANEDADLNIAATELTSQFELNEAEATAKYLDKVIEIEGIVTSIEPTEIVLNDQVQVGFTTEIQHDKKKGKSVLIKGRCVGYDELLEMVKIDQAILIHKNN